MGDAGLLFFDDDFVEVHAEVVDPEVKHVSHQVEDEDEGAECHEEAGVHNLLFNSEVTIAEGFDLVGDADEPCEWHQDNRDNNEEGEEHQHEHRVLDQHDHPVYFY